MINDEFQKYFDRIYALMKSGNWYPEPGAKAYRWTTIMNDDLGGEPNAVRAWVELEENLEPSPGDMVLIDAIGTYFPEGGWQTISLEASSTWSKTLRHWDTLKNQEVQEGKEIKEEPVSNVTVTEKEFRDLFFDIDDTTWAQEEKVIKLLHQIGVVFKPKPSPPNQIRLYMNEGPGERPWYLISSLDKHHCPACDCTIWSEKAFWVKHKGDINGNHEFSHSLTPWIK